jgi:hypothetical protein
MNFLAIRLKLGAQGSQLPGALQRLGCVRFKGDGAIDWNAGDVSTQYSAKANAVIG